MKCSFRLLGAVVAFMALCAASPALADDRFNQGAWTATVAQDPADGTPSVTVGYLVIDNLELDAEFGYQKFDTDVAGVTYTDKAMAFGAGVTYYLPTGTQVVPMLGGGFTYFDQSDEFSATDLSGTGFGVGAGVAFLVGPHGSVNIQATYQSGSVDDNLGGGSADISGITLDLAYQLYFY